MARAESTHSDIKNSGLKRVLKSIRAAGTFWLPDQTLEHLEAIREHELSLGISLLPPEGRLLEIGAGTGWQARTLAAKGYDVRAIEIASSNYASDRIWEIEEYDGHHIPFPDDTFDIVFSSNVLEHIPHRDEFQEEILRVLKPEGVAVHILPSSSWRFWTNLTHLIRYWTIPGVHGEHASNAISEMGEFRRQAWRDVFSRTGWTIVAEYGSGLFYTGSSIMDSRLGIGEREKLSSMLGDACNVFVLKPIPRD